MSIKFDSNKALKDFKKHLVTYLLSIQEELLKDTAAGMQTNSGRTDLTAEKIEEMAGCIFASIVGGPWATMDEWGTGSLMDISNPALAAYRASDMWNPARHDTVIRSRPETPGQRNIFGKPVRGKGKGGVDLESLGKAKPLPPSHAMRDAFRWMKNDRFKKYLQKAISTFPWGKYLKVVNTKG